MNCQNDPCLDDHFPVEVYHFFSRIKQPSRTVRTRKKDPQFYPVSFLPSGFANIAGLENDAKNGPDMTMYSMYSLVEKNREEFFPAMMSWQSPPLASHDLREKKFLQPGKAPTTVATL